MFGRQGHPWPPAPGEAPRARGEAPQAIPERLREGLPPYLDELAPGDTNELGSYTFSPDDIIGFARQYDPQPFHTDTEAARHSLFGGLCASGWHTAAVWMKLMIATRGRIQAEAERQGYRPPRLGSSPGFRNLRWSKPVYAGDTITYRSTITGARPSATRPGWGMAFHRNTGVNQDSEEVFSFDGAVFWERRPEGQS
jgi:acyl dehydratase